MEMRSPPNMGFSLITLMIQWWNFLLLTPTDMHEQPSLAREKLRFKISQVARCDTKWNESISCHFASDGNRSQNKLWHGTMEAPGIRSIMLRGRFLLILTLFHCTDNERITTPEDPNHDRRGKIKELMILLVARWQSAYYPAREISIDETIIPFKSRTGMKVYKPHKWGLNSWNLAEARTGYVWNSELHVYQGKWNNETEVGLYSKVMTTLCQPIYNRGHVTGPVSRARYTWCWGMRHTLCKSYRHSRGHQEDKVEKRWPPQYYKVKRHQTELFCSAFLQAVPYPCSIQGWLYWGLSQITRHWTFSFTASNQTQTCLFSFYFSQPVQE